jgi:hypothetical protein
MQKQRGETDACNVTPGYVSGEDFDATNACKQNGLYL